MNIFSKQAGVHISMNAISFARIGTFMKASKTKIAAYCVGYCFIPGEEVERC